MKENRPVTKSFAHCMSQRVTKIADRAIAFLYYYAKQKNSGATLKQIKSDFENAGLGRPNITKLRTALTKDRRTSKIKKDEWRLRADKLIEVEKNFHLDQCFKKETIKPTSSDKYVDRQRLQELKKIEGQFDLSRLIQMLSELDNAFSAGNYISVILLMRSILDHVPPIFNLTSFAEVANNYGSKSFKDSMSHLENSSRKIADSYLHTRIRDKESLPNKTQVNFSNGLDVLLAEIVRIN